MTNLEVDCSGSKLEEEKEEADDDDDDEREGDHGMEVVESITLALDHKRIEAAEPDAVETETMNGKSQQQQEELLSKKASDWSRRPLIFSGNGDSNKRDFLSPKRVAVSEKEEEKNKVVVEENHQAVEKRPPSSPLRVSGDGKSHSHGSVKVSTPPSDEKPFPTTSLRISARRASVLKPSPFGKPISDGMDRNLLKPLKPVSDRVENNPSKPPKPTSNRFEYNPLKPPKPVSDRIDNNPLKPSKPISDGVANNPLKPLKLTFDGIDYNSLKPLKPTSDGIDNNPLSSPSAEFRNGEGKPIQEGDMNLIRAREMLKQRKPRVVSAPSKKVCPPLTEEEAAMANPNLAALMLRQAKALISSGANPHKALDYATRATRMFSRVGPDGKPSLDLVTSLHILAALHCSLGHYQDSLSPLHHSLEVLDRGEGWGDEYALVAFGGYMQMGDTLSLLGRTEEALEAYSNGLQLQKKTLGDMDPRVGETCRYVAEANAQAMRFEKAEELCQHTLDIHKEHSPPASLEEATDQRLMGLICNGKGEHESALEHLALASMVLIASGREVEVAAVDASMGDTYVSLGRFDEAVFSYQKALVAYKSARGEMHASVASVYASLAQLYARTGKLQEAKAYCESALKIYGKEGSGSGEGGSGSGGHKNEEVVSGLTEIAGVYESVQEYEQALGLLHKSLSLIESTPGQQSAAAGVEAQIGIIHYMTGKFPEAHALLESAVSKLKACAPENNKTSPSSSPSPSPSPSPSLSPSPSSLLGIMLNLLGLSCAQLQEIEASAKHFEAAKTIFEDACGPCHPDTLAVYSNLAGAYDALGRVDDAIDMLERVVEMREEKLGTANPEVNDERRRLAELLKEAGRSRAPRSNKTLELLMKYNNASHNRRGSGSSRDSSGTLRGE